MTSKSHVTSSTKSQYWLWTETLSLSETIYTISWTICMSPLHVVCASLQYGGPDTHPERLQLYSCWEQQPSPTEIQGEEN